MKPGFVVVNSQDLNALAAICAQVIRRAPLTHPLVPEKIVVMSLGMRTYLNQEIARVNGIAAGLEFRQVWQLIWDIRRALFPLASDTLFARLTITWNIVSLYPVWNDPCNTAFARMQDYVREDRDGRRRYELAARLADTFDSYQMYRPDWILAWDAMTEEDFRIFDAGDETGKVGAFLDAECARLKRDARKSTAARESLKSALWQARLWVLLRRNLRPLDAMGRELNPDSADPAERECCKLMLEDRAEVMRSLTRALYARQGQLEALPERVFIFGVSSLPPQVIDFLQALGQVRQVYLMLLNPCSEYWGDLSDRGREDFLRFRKEVLTCQKTGDFKLGAPLRPEASDAYLKEEAYAEGERVDGNQLLLSLGRQGRDNLSLLLNLEPVPEFINCYPETEPSTLLSHLQNQLLSLNEAFPRVEVAPDDHSLEIHVCHTRRREVEVLKDAILRRFKEAKEKGEELLPRDIVVMVPTINDYATHITAVFGADDPDDPAYLPCAISDRTTLEASPVADAVVTLLQIGSHPVTASLVCDLLSVPEIGAHFGIGSDDVGVIGQWLQDNAVYWGLDDADVKKEGELSLPCTFEEGLSKMLLGTMLGASESAVSYPEIEGADTELLGRLSDFIAALLQLRQIFTPELTQEPSQWKDSLNRELIERFFDRDESSYRDFCIIDGAIEDLRKACLNLKTPPRITLPVFCAMLAHALTTERDYTPYLKDKVNFCSLVPMRAVPFKHIFILGLNDLDFPRQERTPGFNLMSLPALYRRGDRSRGNDDRFLFLEALISARKSLYFSYIGESPVSEQELSPSPVLAELMDYIADNFSMQGDASRGALERQLIFKEHLSAYHEDNYRPRQGLCPSFDRRNFIAPAALTGKKRSFLGQKSDWNLNLGEVLSLTVQDVVTFLRRPCRHFLRNALNLTLTDYTDTGCEDVEPFVLEDFELKLLASELIGRDDTQALNYLKRERDLGKLPYGVFEKLACTAALEKRAAPLQTLRNLTGLKSLGEIGLTPAARHTFDVRFTHAGKELHTTVSLASQAHTRPVIVDLFKKPDALKPGQVFAAFGEALSQYLHDGALKGVSLILADGTLKEMEPFTESELEELRDEALTLYVLGSLRPLPVTEGLLEAYSEKDGAVSLNVSALGYDEEARYLFGDGRVIEEDPALLNLYLRVRAFFLVLKAHFPEGRSNDKEGA